MKILKAIFLTTLSLTFMMFSQQSFANMSDNFVSSPSLMDTLYPEITTKHDFCIVDSLALSLDTLYISYEWSTGQTDSIIYVYTPGIYKVTVFDEAGNSGEAFQEVTDFVLDGPRIIGDTLMCDENTQILQITDSLYRDVQWYRPNDTIVDIRDSLAFIQIDTAGTYLVRVLDSLGCTAFDSFHVQYYDTLGIKIFGDTIFCPGSTNEINIDTVNLISFLWTNGDSINISQTIDEAGIYEVRGIDTFGCMVAGEIKVDLFEIADIPLSADSLFCQGSELTIYADTSDIQEIAWLGGEIADSIIIDTAGIYTITGVDTNLCTVNGSIEVGYFETEAIPILGGYQFCEGQSHELYIEANNLKEITWSNESKETNITVDEIGEFSVTAIDSNGCQVGGSIILEYYPTESVNIQGDLNICPNQVGVLYIDPTLYSNVEWDSGVKSDSLYIVATGEYSITATDVNGCYVEGNVNVSQTPPFTPAIEGDESICSNQVSTLMVADEYELIEWSNGKTTRVIQVTEPGEYVVTVTDENGCEGINAIFVEVAQFTPPTIEGEEFICIGGQTELSIEGQGYTNIFWDNFEETASITVSEAGSYTVNATDEKGCQGSSTFIVFEHPYVEVDIEGDTRLCAESSGILLVNNNNVSSLTWDDGSTENNLPITECDKTYSLDYTDLNNCEYSTEIHVACHDSIEINLLNTIDVSCHDGSDGLLAVKAETNNEDGQFMYDWDGGSSNQLINNLSAGIYEVTVTDIFGCTNVANYEVIEPAPLSLQVETLINRSCFYSEDNFIEFEGDGGAGNFRYTWLDETIQENIEAQFLPGDSVHAIPDGIYQIEVMDQNECIDTFSIEFQGPDTIKVDNSNIQEVICFGGETGTIELSASGGTGALNYEWTHGDNGAMISSLSAGDYTVEIIDENECSIQQSFTLDQNQAITVQHMIDNESITGAMDGSININIFGGTGTEYNIEWSNGSNTSTINGLSPGEYTVTITDEALCTKEISYVVGAGDCGVDATLETNKISCFGFTDGGVNVILSNLVVPYRVFVNGSAYENNMGNTNFSNLNFELENLGEGDYALEFLDAANCNRMVEFSLSEPPEVTVDLFVGNFASCEDSEDGTIISNVGEQIITGYNWSTGSQESNLTNIAPGIYELTVTDENQCSNSASIELGFEDTVLPTLVLQDIEVYLDENGSFDWPAAKDFDNGSSDNCSTVNFNYEIPTDYDCSLMDTISIDIAGRDINNNVAIGIANVIVLDSIAPLILIDTIRISSCDSVELALVETNFSDNCRITSFGWDNTEAAKGPFAEGQTALQLSVADNYGNSATKEVIVLNEVVIEVEYTLFEPRCFEFNDGEIVFETDGTNAPFKVNYDDDIDIEALTAGLYTFTINDKTGCERVLEIEVNEPSLLEYSVVDFNDDPDIGFIEIDLFGGTSPYGFQWLKDGLLYSNDKDIYNLPAGLYELTMLDSKGCTIVSEPFYIGISSNDNLAVEYDINVYPNPTTGILTIDLSDIELQDEMSIRIFDLQGNLVVETSSSNEQNISLDLSALPSEMYLLQLSSSELSYLQKVVKSDY